MARSPALLAFGGDSAIELLSAIAVLWRFRVDAAQEHAENLAARIAAVVLFVLAAYVAAVSVMTLLGHSEPKSTYLGIAILIAASAIMPWLAKEKRRLSAIRQRRTQGGCRRIRFMRLSFCDCSCWPWNQRDLAHLVGRPDCCSRDCSAHLLGRMGSHARQSLWLLLSNRQGGRGLVAPRAVSFSMT
jgi:hypothetical protein